MNTKTLALETNETRPSRPWVLTLLHGGYYLIKTIISLMIAAIVALFLMWVKQKQDEFDVWDGKPQDK
jgi:hypothetical protein